MRRKSLRADFGRGMDIGRVPLREPVLELRDLPTRFVHRVCALVRAPAPGSCEMRPRSRPLRSRDVIFPGPDSATLGRSLPWECSETPGDTFCSGNAALHLPCFRNSCTSTSAPNSGSSPPTISTFLRTEEVHHEVSDECVHRIRSSMSMALVMIVRSPLLTRA